MDLLVRWPRGLSSLHKFAIFFLENSAKVPMLRVIHFMSFGGAAVAPGTSGRGNEKRLSPAIPDRLLHIVSFQDRPLRWQRWVQFLDGGAS